MAIRQQKDKFTAIFRNGALDKLKELAKIFEIPEDQLGEVLMKGLKVIDLAKDGKIIVEKENERLEVDLKKL